MIPIFYRRNEKRRMRPTSYGISTYRQRTVSIANPFAGIAKIISDTVQLADSILDLKGFVRAISDIVNITEPAGQLIIRYIALAMDTLQSSEIVQRVMGFVRSVIDTIQSSESSSTIGGFVRVISETLNTVETIIDLVSATTAQIIKLVAESVSISGSTIDLRGLHRFINSTISVSETIYGGLINLIKLIAETVNASEAILKSRVLVRLISETENATETIIRILTTGITQLTKFISEQIQISTSGLGAVLTQLTKVIKETIQISTNTIFSGVIAIIGYLKTKFNVKPALKTLLRILKNE